MNARLQGATTGDAAADRKAPRADARRNAALVLAGARRAVAAKGLDVSYHEIAREAGVGVGTVYRRFPERDQLMAAVLRDILDELIRTAEAAMQCADPWEGFTRLFGALAARTAENAGLSGTLDAHGGPDIAALRHRLLRLLRQTIERAQQAGALRSDVDWHDIPFLAQAAATPGCFLGLPADPGRGQRTLSVILDGLHGS
ncbi:TetR/AcrR family transcriptional regulator [Streptomyces varsoviensis]|uniref:TetR family transcriptional regulator n=1 Tax=Streptomyces varsoviensis TaxID=67373 RepID=A0ABR5IZ45_9ACTN|nr:TetR/AcrR family transcriptional regulator [Streptomyces varsoviensis]KOG86391.1 TetR family transcriptional regulator [Streptomyces varsoviensis]